MRIAIGNPRRGWGGVSTVVFDLAEGLQARGHEVVIFCRRDSRLHQRAANRIPCEPILRRRDFPFATIAECVRALRRHGTEVALSGLAVDLRLTGVAARLAGVPVAVHWAAPLRLDTLPPARWIRRGIPDHYIAPSGAIHDLILASAPRLDPARVTRIYNGIAVDRFAAAAPADLALPAGALAIGFMGRLDPQKGLGDLAAAWPRIVREVPNAHLLLAGEGRERAALERSFDGDPRVHWLGFRSDAPALMRAFDLLVVPSRWEPFGLVAAEAMAAGTPVVATRVDGLAEVVDDGATGRLVPVRCPEALANAVIEIARDPDGRERMGSLGAARIRERFSLECMVDGYEALFARLIEDGAGGKRAGRTPAAATP